MARAVRCLRTPFPHAAFRRSASGAFRFRPRFSGEAFSPPRPSRLPAGRFAPGRSSETAGVRADERACRDRTLLRQTASPVDALAKQGGENMAQAAAFVKIIVLDIRNKEPIFLQASGWYSAA